VKKQAKYTERKSIRLSPRDAYILDESGYSPREAIEYFNRIFCSTEERGLKIDLLNLEKKLKEQELEVIKTKEEIRKIKKDIENEVKPSSNLNTTENNDIQEILTIDQCIDKIKEHLENAKTSPMYRSNKKKGIKSVKDLPDTLFEAIAKKGKIEVKELKKIAFEKIK
jgi:hypothetical protein